MKNDSHSPLVSVIIVNYNGSPYLQRLFSSLYNQSFSNFEIIFVDNASSDDSINIVEKLRKDLGKDLVIKIIRNERNLGYCKGNNIGVLSTDNRSKYLVFLNNDTYVDADWLKKLVERAKSDDLVGAVGSKIISNGHVMMGLACDVYGQTEGIVLWDRDTKEVTHHTHQRAKLFYCSGASILIPKDVFQKVGGFDETFFMYHDDIDLCWRIRVAGYRIVLESSSVCYHIKDDFKSGFGLDLPVWKFYHGLVKNRIRTLLKNYTMINIVRYLPLSIILIALRGLLSSFINRNVQYIIVLIMGLLWNIKHLRDTLLKRMSVQQLRKVSDKEILLHMLPHSLEITYFKRFWYTYNRRTKHEKLAEIPKRLPHAQSSH